MLSFWFRNLEMGQMNEFQEQVQDTVNELFPNLHICVGNDCHRPTIQLCIVDFILNFPIDRIEWIKNTTDAQQKSLIKIRIYDMLRTHKEYIEELMIRCKQ